MKGFTSGAGPPALSQSTIEPRRGLERRVEAGARARGAPMALIATRLARLRELIAALDRRVPRVERVGEASIARDAAALKKKALKRIAELENESSLKSAAAPRTAKHDGR